jgi:hypothetical protein
VHRDEDEKMEGEERIADAAAYLYQIDRRYLIGVHGRTVGFLLWRLGVLYDLLAFRWHEKEPWDTEYNSADEDDGDLVLGF